MVQFICTTQTTQMAGFSAATGIVYQSMLNTPFHVTEPKDIEYFENNRRFQKVGLLEKVGLKSIKKSEAQPQNQIDIALFLKDVKGVTKATVEKLIASYDTVEFLREEIELGGDLSNLQIPEKQVFLIKQKIIGEQ